MASSQLTIFDKLCDNLGNSMTMEKILEFALLGKVIVSYEISSLKSFHDRLFQGLWKKSPNGCFYPLDVGHEKVVYVIVNDSFEFETEKSMEKLRSFSVAHNTFDEMSEPVSSSNLSQHVSFMDENAITCGNIEMKSDDVDEFSVSKINGQDVDEKSLIDNGCTQGYGAYVKEDGVDSVVGDCSLVCNLQQAIDYDKMPTPTFMLEMAQSAKTTQGEPFEVDHELESHEVSEIHVASLEYERHMVAKLGSLDGPCFRVLVSIGASRERFCLLLGLLFDQCQSLDDAYEQCDKISYPKHPRFQKVLAEISKPKHKSASPLVLSLEPKNVTTFTPFQVTISTLLFVDVENEVLWWGENCMSSECVVWKTMSDSTYYHIIFDPGISFCSINNAEICPYTVFFELRNGCELEISYKEALSWGNLSQCCEFAMTSSSFRALNSDNDVGSEMILLLSKYWKVFAINLSSSLASVEIVKGTHAPNTPWVFIFFDPSYLDSDTSSIFFTDTLEDKGDFRGVDDTSETCTRELFNPLHLWCNYITSWTKKIVGFLIYVFDPGGLRYNPSLLESLTSRGLFIFDVDDWHCDTLWTEIIIRDHLRSYCLLLMTMSKSSFVSFHGSGTEVMVHPPTGCLILNLIRLSGLLQACLIFAKTGVKLMTLFWVFNWGGIVGECNLQLPKETLFKHFDLGGSFGGYSCKSSHSISCSIGIQGDFACLVWVFDPGGNDKFMPMTRNIFAGDLCSFGLHGGKMDHGREIQGNHAILIFDPGGQALDGVAHVTNLQPKECLCSVIGCPSSQVVHMRKL